MKKYYKTLFIMLLCWPSIVSFAQRATPVFCGDVIEGRFSQAETHEYTINMEEDNILLIHAEVTEDYSDDLYLRIFLSEPDGDEIERAAGAGRNGVIGLQTRPLPVSGQYSIYVDNNTYDIDGEYAMYVDCITSDGDVISRSRFVHSSECGQIINSEFVVAEWHKYFIVLNEDDTIDITLESTEDYNDDLYLRIFFSDPDGDEIERVGGSARNGSVTIQTRPLPVSGMYTIYVDNNTYNIDGEYALYISCETNGESIQAGDVPWNADNDLPQASSNENLLVVAAGSFQSEIGCPRSNGVGGDWNPECELSQLSDDDGDGIYTWTTNDIPEGNWEVKITVGGTWDENYGADGEADGANISFRVRDDGDRVTFSYDSNSHELEIDN